MELTNDYEQSKPESPAGQKRTETELLSAISLEERNAYGYLTGNLATERAKALDYYLGEPFGNEVKDRSQVISTDVADTVEWILPSLVRIFLSGDEVVSFAPRGPEDVQSAEQETDAVNFIAMDRNPGFANILAWFKDGLLMKNAYVKVWADETQDVEEESYEGLNDQELQIILSSPGVEPVEYETVVDATGMPLHNIKIKVTNTERQIKWAPVPSEEALVSTRTRNVSLQDTEFFQHRRKMTLSELREMGYEVEDDIDDSGDDLDADQIAIAREIEDEAINSNATDEGPNRRVVYRESYIRYDFDGDGISELRRVCHVGTKVFSNTTCDLIPFAAITPILMPHRHIGRSVAETIFDIQEIKSTLIRQVLDNVYLSNNGRTAVNADRVNLDDLLSVRPGGIVRVNGDPAGAVMPFTTPQLGAPVFNLLEYMDTVRENRTGVTRYNQGIDANSLNKTATGISQIMNAAAQRIELIARTFAETGVKELFGILHAMMRKYSQKEMVMQLRGEWVTVDPRQWKKRTDFQVSVGLGTGNKDTQAAHLMQILQIQEKVFPLGVASPQNIFNALSKFVENAGYKQPEQFFTDPQNLPPKPPKPDPVIEKEKIKAEADMYSTDVNAAVDLAKAQQDAYVPGY